MLLYQPKNGYAYNSDSIFLSDFINSFSPKGKVLDVGAGCGILGLLVARDNPKISLEAVEKQSVFMEFSKINARVNKIDYTLHESNFLELPIENKYAYIISNPPFYHDGVTKSDNEILFNARYNVNLPLKDFFKKVSQLLKPKAHFIFCYDASQFGLICVELEKVKLRVVDVRFVHSRSNKGASLVMIHVRNSSLAMMNILNPLIVFDENGMSKEAQLINEKASTQSIKCQL